jgi:hypothetical protein
LELRTWLDQSEGVGNIASSCNPGPQVQYLVEKMVESKQNLVEVVNRLSVKIDSYDKRITALGSDISKV